MQTTVIVRRAVVDVAAFAEEAFAAECFHVDGHAIAGSDLADRRSDCQDDPDRLVSDRDTGDRTGHAAVLDMQIAGADGRKRDPYYRVRVRRERGFRFFGKAESAFFDISVSAHICFR